MILEALAILCGSVCAISLGSIKLVSVLDARDREEDKEDRERLEEAERVANEPTPKLVPYDARFGSEGAPCPICGAAAASEYKGAGDYVWVRGPGHLTSCSKRHCAAKATPHLHTFCKSCHSALYVQTKNDSPAT